MYLHVLLFLLDEEPLYTSDINRPVVIIYFSVVKEAILKAKCAASEYRKNRLQKTAAGCIDPKSFVKKCRKMQLYRCIGFLPGEDVLYLRLGTVHIEQIPHP